MALVQPLPRPAGSPAVLETASTLKIDVAAVAANWRTLARAVTTAQCAAVVKANAYGLGIEPITAALAKAGCGTFFVADLAEARRVRASAAEAEIYVLNGFMPDAGDTYMEIDAKPVINSSTELAEWDAFVAGRNWHGGAALQVDTGMNRLGIPLDEAAAIAARVQVANHGISLLMSHLACADIVNHPLNAAQIRLFHEMRLLYQGVPASLANSSGIFLGDSTHCDLARPGAALYGINPTPGRPNPMQSVVELSGRVLQIRTLDRGESVGYGATWSAKRPSRIAIAALGYADGLPRAAGTGDRSRGGVALLADKPCPFAGRISMDLICLDITDLPQGVVRRGDAAIFIGGSISVDDLAAAAGTIGYEILTHLGPRCHIVYRGEA